MPRIELVSAWVMLASLVAYVLLAGADFGAGVWDILARGQGGRAREQRRFIAAAIGPIWEANHVWLILLVVIMFTCFPGAFAAAMTALHVPATLVLIGIVLRGSAFVFRAYTPPAAPDDPRADAVRLRWGRIFSIASIATPVMLGVTLGTTASGTLVWDEQGVYVSGFFDPWLRPFPWSVGAFALAIFAYLAAVYLCAEAAPRAGGGAGGRRDPLLEDFRRRALGAAVAVGITAAATWVLAYRGAALLSDRLAGDWWALPLQIATGTCAIGAIVSLWRRRFVLARTLAVAQVTLILLGYGAALFPCIIVPQFTIENAAAPARTHQLVLAALAAGAIILLPSLWYLYRVFKGRRVFALTDEA
jgi:cytochrome d ubiquinol oxidase subunit II